MARTIRNAKLDTRTGRSFLAPRREPYWTVISPGCALGYRRGAKAGTWIARMRAEDGRQRYEALGGADDARDPDGLTVFSFAQAQSRARDYFTATARKDAGQDARHVGPYTVRLAMADYLSARERRGSRGVKADRYAADARILPELGDIEIARLTTRRIRDWHDGLASAPLLRRTKAGAENRRTAPVRDDPDAVRARRSTANRLLTVLKASLNFAFHEGHAPTDDAWRKVLPFREADAPTIRYLSADECRRLVNASAPGFRDLVRGALVTGARYSELARLRAQDFDAAAGTIAIRVAKSGKPRHVALADEGRALFTALTVGRPGKALIFERANGSAWGASHQQRHIETAARVAKIDPAPSFHILRHTYASSLAMRSVPLTVIAAQLGHADTRVTQRHYAHLAPGYVAETVRAALPSLGILDADDGRVVAIR